MEPLISLADVTLADLTAAWVEYADEHPRYVPKHLAREWRYVQHVTVCGPFGVQFWYRGRNDPRGKWLWLEQTG